MRDAATLSSGPALQGSSLRAVPIFRAAPESVLAVLAGGHRAVLLAAGQSPRWEGSPDILLVASTGQLGVFHHTTAGTRTCVLLLDAGEPLQPAHDGEWASTRVEALVDGTTAHILEQAVLAESMEAWPPLYRLLLPFLAQGQHAAMRRAAELAALTMPERLVRILAWLAMGHPQRRVSLTHEVLAELVATRRTAISEELRSLSRAGLIDTSLHGRGLTVLPALPRSIHSAR